MSQVKLTADSGGGTTSLKAPSSTTSDADVVLKLPVADGSANQVLKTDGSGQLSFTSNAGTTINNNADNRVITGSGTANTLNGESNVVIDSSGNVGIGETSPDTALHIKSADNILATFESTDADALIEFKDNGTSDTILMGALGGDDLLLRCDAGNIVFKLGNNSEKMRIDSSGKVGIGETTPLAQLHIKPASNMSQLLLEQNNATDGYALFQDGPNGGHLKFMRHINGSDTQKLLLRSEGGLCFGTDSAAANALDDYEEGTWTPTESSGLSLTVYVANYIKIGRVVHIETGLLVPTNSDGGAIQFGGLPFTAVSSGDNSGGLHLTSTNSGRSDLFFALRGQTLIGVGTNQNLSVARSAYSNKQVKFSGTYISV